jgi:hypothetical protein
MTNKSGVKLLWTPDALLETDIVDIAKAVGDAGINFRPMQSAMEGQLIVGNESKRFGECLRLYREHAVGMNLTQFAHWMDMSSTTQSRLEDDGPGSRHPSAGYLMRLRFMELKRRTSVVKYGRKAGDKAAAGTVKIDRTTRFGNPFSVRGNVAVECRCETREESVRKFMTWALDPQRQWYLDHLPTFLGQTLGCWCVPELCHGHVTLALVRRLPWSGRMTGQSIDAGKLWEDVQEAVKVSMAVEFAKSIVL